TRREQGLPHAQRLIVGAGQWHGRRGAEDAAEFFEQGMRVRLAQFASQAAAPAFEPGAKRREADFDALGNRDRIDEFTETHEFDVLRRILVAVCAVEPALRSFRADAAPASARSPVVSLDQWNLL